MIRKLTLIFVPFFYIQILAAENIGPPLQMVPADIFNLNTPGQSLVYNIDFPEGDNDMKLFLRCETMVSARGNFLKPYCYDKKEQNEIFIRYIFHGMKRSKAIPALVKGEETYIWTPFSILFKRSNGKEKITLLSNHLNHVKEYGYFYTAPQRYQDRSKTHCGLPLLKPTLFIQRITDNGVVDKVEHQKGRCADTTAKSFEDALYIPAQVNNNFVKGTVSEYIFPSNRIKRK